MYVLLRSPGDALKFLLFLVSIIVLLSEPQIFQEGWLAAKNLWQFHGFSWRCFNGQPFYTKETLRKRNACWTDAWTAWVWGFHLVEWLSRTHQSFTDDIPMTWSQNFNLQVALSGYAKIPMRNGFSSVKLDLLHDIHPTCKLGFSRSRAYGAGNEHEHGWTRNIFLRHVWT